MAGPLISLNSKKLKLKNAGKLKVGLVVSAYHIEITKKLLVGAEKLLVLHGVKSKNIFIAEVPGAFELPLGASLLNDSMKPDAVVCLGCVIKGETLHSEYINHSVANALQQLSMQHGIPFVFGLLTTMNLQQAEARSGGAKGNKGAEAAMSALGMIALKHKVETVR